MPSLFAYGTLCNQHVQNILFGRTLQGRDYVLEGYTVCRCIDGFYTINESRCSSVAGRILEITDEDLIVADEWELVPLYKRIHIKMKNKDCWTYIRSDMTEIVDDSADGDSAYSEEELLGIVREFMEQRQPT